MLPFPQSMFELQLDFAEAIAGHYTISFEEALFKYTTIYTRIIGFSDFDPPRQDHPKWVEFLRELQKQKDRVGFTYRAYETFEKNKTNTDNGQKIFGSFSYAFLPERNMFAMHFLNSDPQGNLGQSRVEARREDLKRLFTSIKEENKPTARMYITTWLLNVEAFNRLFPPLFISSKKLRNKGTVQDNGTWGQFVDRNGDLKEDLAAQLRKNMTVHRPTIDEYFPLPMMRAEAEQQLFFDFYL